MAETLELADMQGILVRGYGNLRAASFLLLRIIDPVAARSWLQSMARAATTGEMRPENTAINVAFTSAGLTRLGMNADVISTFSQEFIDGMATPYRSRILGDVGASAPGRWMWGGTTTGTVDLLLLLYGKDMPALEGMRNSYRSSLGAHGLDEMVMLDTVDLGDKEHFGFHDGISQPLIDGLPKAGLSADTVKAGEFILGYVNEYGLYTERPLVALPADSEGQLAADVQGSGKGDLGRNGSYLVLRQLSQDVTEFAQFVDDATRTTAGSSQPAEATRLAAKMVGRWQSGAPLVLAPDEDSPALANENDFAYFHVDPDGYRCPIGAHVRRSNPRDSLDPRPGSARSVSINQRHRLLRRGREYGNPLGADSNSPSDEDRGLHFICLNGNLSRQFEFVQHTWVNNPKFHGLYSDADPIIGGHPDGSNTFTVQAEPVRRRYTGLPNFVTVRGGAYFFVPGIRALRYLSTLRGTNAP